MGMFSYKSNYLTESMIDLDSIQAQECFEENAMDSAFRIVAENTANWNSIMEAIGMDELAVYESTGREMVYEGGTVSAIFDKIKDFFKKLIEKIKGIFAKFMTVLNSWVKSDSEFVKKYKSDILKANIENFQFKGYKFTFNRISLSQCNQSISEDIKSSFSNRLITNGTTGEFEAAAREIKDGMEEALEIYRGQMLGRDNSRIETSEFAKECFESFRNGESEKELLDESDIDISDCLLTIETTEKTKREAEKLYKAIQKGFTDAIREVDGYSKECLRNVTKGPDEELNAAKVKYYSSVCSYGEQCKSINTIFFGAYIQAIKDKNRQCKSICVKLLTRKQPKNESTSWYEEGGSMLSSVSLK